MFKNLKAKGRSLYCRGDSLQVPVLYSTAEDRYTTQAENTQGLSPAARLWIRAEPTEPITVGTHEDSRQDLIYIYIYIYINIELI